MGARVCERGAAVFKSGGCDGGGGSNGIDAPKVGACIGGGEMVDGAFAPKKKLCIGGDETANAASTLKTGGSAGGGGGNPDT